MKHKLLIVLLCLADIALSNSLSAATVAYGSCGVNVNWTLDDQGNLIISGTGNMADYSNYNDIPWKRYKTYITSAVIESGVTSIGNHAFYGCKGLMHVTIDNSVISIGENAFSKCSGLTSIDIPDGVISIGGNAFSECSGLTSIDIPDGVRSIRRATFSGCSGLTSIIIPNSVTNIGAQAFEGCSRLSSINIPNSVTDIGQEAFSRCAGLISVTIGNGVVEIQNFTFHFCTGLISITIPNSVRYIFTAFEGCSSLTSLTIPNSVISIASHAFSGCSGITSITCEAITPPANWFRGAEGVDFFDGVDKSIPLYVPQQSIRLYKNVFPWSDFYNIKAIGTAIDEVMEIKKGTTKLIQDGQVFFLLPDGTRYSILGQITN